MHNYSPNTMNNSVFSYAASSARLRVNSDDESLNIDERGIDTAGLLNRIKNVCSRKNTCERPERPHSASLRSTGWNPLKTKLTDERHAGVGRPQLVGGHARVVSEAILGHVGHREDWSGAEALDIDTLSFIDPAKATQIAHGSAWSGSSERTALHGHLQQFIPHLIFAVSLRRFDGLKGERNDPGDQTAGRHLTRCLSYCCRGGGDADKCYSSCSRHQCAEAHVGLLTLVGVMIFSSLRRLELAVPTRAAHPVRGVRARVSFECSSLWIPT